MTESDSAKSQAKAGVFVLLLISAIAMVHGYSSFKAHQKAEDAKFCRENLTYYENFCKVYLGHCAEGALVLAKCQH